MPVCECVSVKGDGERERGGGWKKEYARDIVLSINEM